MKIAAKINMIERMTYNNTADSLVALGFVNIFTDQLFLFARINKLWFAIEVADILRAKAKAANMGLNEYLTNLLIAPSLSNISTPASGPSQPCIEDRAGPSQNP
jgi:hypothetical protein